jgi:hypothetical protein
MPSLNFDGSEPLAVLTFFRQLNLDFDESGITELTGSRFLFDFVSDDGIVKGFRGSNYQPIPCVATSSSWRNRLNDECIHDTVPASKRIMPRA